jgi:hypothetical protein
VFLRLYDFSEDLRAETWKFAPWAYADRLWFVYRPARPLPIGGPMPTVNVNGKDLALIPRVDHRAEQYGGKAEKHTDPNTWKCPMFFADITPVARFGGTNTVRLARMNEAQPANCFVISGGDRR